MNKFFCLLVVVGFAAVASAVPHEVVNELPSELTVTPTDDEETAFLKGSNKVFADFCIQSRDEIMSYIRQASREKSSNVFSALFGSVNEVGQAILNSEKEALEQGTAAIRNEPAAKAAAEVEKALETSSPSVLNTVRSAVQSVISAILATARSEFFDKIGTLKAQFTSDQIKEMLEDACTGITGNLDSMVKKQLSEAKRSLAKASQEDFSKVTHANVGCLTAGRVAKAASVCSIFKLAGPSVYQLLGY